MRRQHRAEEVGTVRAHQLAGVVRQDVHHVPVVRPRPQGPRGGHGPVAVSNLTAGEGRRGRREPSGRGRLYGNMHHNSLGQRHLTDCRVRFVPEERGFFFSLLERSAFLSLFLSVFSPLPPDVAGLESPTTCARRMEARKPQSHPCVRDTTGSAILACYSVTCPGVLRVWRTWPSVSCKVSHTSKRVLNRRAALSRPLSLCATTADLQPTSALSLTHSANPPSNFLSTQISENLRAVVQKKKS